MQINPKTIANITLLKVPLLCGIEAARKGAAAELYTTGRRAEITQL
jgi:hypothetical protein